MVLDVRLIVRDLIMGLPGGHKDYDHYAIDFGLPIPSRDAPPGAESGPTKAERLEKTFRALDPREYPRVLQVFLDNPELRGQGVSVREMQDALWSYDHTAQEVNERARRELATAIEGELDLNSSNRGAFLNVLQEGMYEGERPVSLPELFGAEPANPFQEVEDNFLAVRKWTMEQLLVEVGALDWPSQRFIRFFQDLTGSRVTPDEDRIRQLAAAARPVLHRHGLDLAESVDDRGYPRFQIIASGQWRPPPQMILFASRRTKPDLRLSDALQVEIEVLSGDDDVLAYTDPVDADGLTWNHLEHWWQQRHPESEDPKTELYNRLKAAVPTTSPQAIRLFEAYHAAMNGRDGQFPALLPEVWVHWDPKNKARREGPAMEHRIDFLLLAPRRRQIILEVDGMQHYATPEGQASKQLYAETVRGDRDLRLSGYEVYRFSTAELDTDQDAQDLLRQFARRLLWEQP